MDNNPFFEEAKTGDPLDIHHHIINLVRAEPTYIIGMACFLLYTLLTFLFLAR
jgi:hypothetical protein